MDISFKSVIAPAFYAMHGDVRRMDHTEYWLQGGRGSTKSSFVSLEIILGMLQDPDANAIVYRRVANTLRESVFGQMVWAIQKLGVSHLFRAKFSPIEITMVQTGQKILFRGADDPAKSKSIKLARGYFKYLWFEELAEFPNMDDIRTIKASIIRGSESALTFYSYNPPRSAKAWVNEEALKPPASRLVHKSTYLDVPKEWIGENFIRDAEGLRDTNETAYRHMYLGEVTGTGGAVFENVITRTITDEEIQTFGYCYMGLDFGWYPDPTQWVHVCYDTATEIVYVFDEYRIWKRPNYDLYVDLSHTKGVPAGMEIIADSADQKAINDLRTYGLTVTGAVKGPGSVVASMRWLQGRKQIVIDPDRCPHTAKEFLEYEFDRARDDTIIDGYPDKDNHSIDAVRYALNRIWMQKGL